MILILFFIFSIMFLITLAALVSAQKARREAKQIRDDITEFRRELIHMVSQRKVRSYR